MSTYLAGPIFGKTDAEAKDWRAVATEQLGDVLDPMRRDYRGREGDFGAEIVEQDKADIDACRTLLAFCPDWSVGTIMEILYAWERRKIVIVVVPPGVRVSPWLTYHSNYVFTSLGEALDKIKALP